MHVLAMLIKCIICLSVIATANDQANAILSEGWTMAGRRRPLLASNSKPDRHTYVASRAPAAFLVTAVSCKERFGDLRWIALQPPIPVAHAESGRV